MNLRDCIGYPAVLHRVLTNQRGDVCAAGSIMWVSSVWRGRWSLRNTPKHTAESVYVTHVDRSRVSVLYGCPGCGDITTGSKSPKREYDCCPDCIERATRMIAKHGERDDDPGPFEERGRFPNCPECGKTTSSRDCELKCDDWDCDHTWTPEGIYIEEGSAG